MLKNDITNKHNICFYKNRYIYSLKIIILFYIFSLLINLIVIDKY